MKWQAELGPRIADARQQCHVVLVAVHWGPNYAHTPGEDARRIGRLLVDMGADAVLGASSHVLQGLEIYRERPIIYDAGNLLFDAIREVPDDSGLFKLSLTANGVEHLTFIPLAGHTGYTLERRGEDAAAACRRYSEKCAALGTPLHTDGDGRMSLALHPETRLLPDFAPAPRIMANGNAIPSQVPVGNLWQMATVPPDARCAPVNLGPLKLVGTRVWPKLIQKRQMLWIETFWTLDAAIEEDLRIDLRATPERQSSMRPWGEQHMDHDPCDWMWPTSRWVPGYVYRDLYGLRPPQMKNWDNVDLRVSVRLVSKGSAFPFHETDHVVRLAARGASAGTSSQKPTEVHPFLGTTWSAEQLQEATGGTWLVPPPAGWEARSFSFSTGMNAIPPSMYIAYDAKDRARHENSTKPIAKNWDRHDDLPGAAAGASICGAMVARPVPGLPSDFPLLLVEDPLKAALQLGVVARERFEGPVIAVTGTVGKSSTVAMVATMLGRDRTLTTQGNFNTRVGTALAVANLNTFYDAAVLEIAQSALWMKRGPITRVIRPTAAIITLIELSQPGAVVKTVEDVAEYKSRIFDGLSGPKIAVLPDYIKFFDKVRAAAQEHASRVVIFGYGSEAEVRILNITSGEEDTLIELQLPTGVRRLTVPVLSKGMAETAVGAFAMIYALGHDLDKAEQALAAFEPEKGRMQRRVLTLAAGGQIELFDDSFNAEVTSMVNAFQLVGRRQPGHGGRRIALLGRIGLLGEMTSSMHASLAEPLIDNKFDLVATHGPEMLYLREKLPQSMLLGPHFSDAASLADHVARRIVPGDLVLIKGEEQDTDFGLVPKLLVSQLTRPQRARHAMRPVDV